MAVRFIEQPLSPICLSIWSRQLSDLQAKGRRRTPTHCHCPRSASEKEVEKAVEVFTKELDPLAVSVKKAVRKAVTKAGDRDAATFAGMYPGYPNRRRFPSILSSASCRD
jgi:hypothetical protein